jgi:hypothetical protein
MQDSAVLCFAVIWQFLFWLSRSLIAYEMAADVEIPSHGELWKALRHEKVCAISYLRCGLRSADDWWLIIMMSGDLC